MEGFVGLGGTRTLKIEQLLFEGLQNLTALNAAVRTIALDHNYRSCLSDIVTSEG